MWEDLLRSLVAILVFVLLPFVVIASVAGLLVCLERLHLVAGHRHQH